MGNQLAAAQTSGYQDQQVLQQRLGTFQLVDQVRLIFAPLSLHFCSPWVTFAPLLTRFILTFCSLLLTFRSLLAPHFFCSLAHLLLA